ncbi:Filamentous growth regulator 27 [Daldinia childiae]|uniref:Filamentous growth regulator 27 n=1 Tax=Daldinia childiae TaxID=326645 RepID=UPI0014476658|nr:Filamentous growth regulator 27 [Daldinia childiae]KAF3062065.1 Filamentous growth regulator 27 [Daldinia childiae]
MDNSDPTRPRVNVRLRVANACDGCKAHKVICKCNLTSEMLTGTAYIFSRVMVRIHGFKTFMTDAFSPQSSVTAPFLVHIAPAGNGRQHATIRLSNHAVHRRLERTGQHAPSGETVHHQRQDQKAIQIKSPVYRETQSDTQRGSSPLATPDPVACIEPSPEDRREQQERQWDAAKSADVRDDEPEVPREARLLCDSQGKLIFIGDCAPLSLFQTVRQIVNSRVDPGAFALQTGYSPVLKDEKAPQPLRDASEDLQVRMADIPRVVLGYESAIQTTGLVDLFSHVNLLNDVTSWAAHSPRPGNPMFCVYMLVLAIGYQETNDELAASYFELARNNALARFGGNSDVATLQTFVLITLYMLGSCQSNSAFLYFGTAVRVAHSIGIHRTEMNARFGPAIQCHRDRLWTSLRVLDLYLSASMGRPPATSDIDCTVSYVAMDERRCENIDLLNASSQIFLIMEAIVIEVYSRRKVSYQLTEGICCQLREWSTRWLPKLNTIVGQAINTADGAHDINDGQEGQNETKHQDVRLVSGACQVLCCYYYAVMLVSRPFLMYELQKRLEDDTTSATYSKSSPISGKSKLADACVDSASFMVDLVTSLMSKRCLNGHRPVVVSWLFASSLVLGAGLLGSFGRIEKYMRNAIQALEKFGTTDAHALQYSRIARSFLDSALEYQERKEMHSRLQRTAHSSQLFGLVRISHHDDQGVVTRTRENTRDDSRTITSNRPTGATTEHASLSHDVCTVAPDYIGLRCPESPHVDMGLNSSLSLLESDRPNSASASVQLDGCGSKQWIADEVTLNLFGFLNEPGDLNFGFSSRPKTTPFSQHSHRFGDSVKDK